MDYKEYLCEEPLPLSNIILRTDESLAQSDFLESSSSFCKDQLFINNPNLEDSNQSDIDIKIFSENAFGTLDTVDDIISFESYSSDNENDVEEFEVDYKPLIQLVQNSNANEESRPIKTQKLYCLKCEQREPASRPIGDSIDNTSISISMDNSSSSSARSCWRCKADMELECQHCRRLLKDRAAASRHAKYECDKRTSFHCPKCDYTASQKIHVLAHVRCKHTRFTR